MTESPAQFEEAKSAGKPPVKPSCMLAKLCHDPFFEKGWIYERKFDGERCLILVRDGEVTLRSRNGESLNDSYPELHEAFRDQDLSDMVIDGEIVAFKGKVTSFSRLQDRIGIQDPEEARKSSVAVYCYVFDLFHHGKQDLSEVPLLKRKQVLRDTLEFNHRIRYSSHRVRNGEDYYQQAHDKGWEGIMAKEADSTYVHGRSSKWLKFKCGRGQEFVIGGFTDPEGDREGFGALLIGVYDGDEFVYAGKVGTGYDDELLRSLRERMDRLERMTSPFDRGDAPDDGVHFVRPELVCEIGFTEWTDDGRLRHPRFKGLRRDKNPEDVTRESP